MLWSAAYHLTLLERWSRVARVEAGEDTMSGPSPEIAGNDSLEHVARAWLEEMEDCVRAHDFARCRAIFAAEVVAFGSKAERLVGLHALEHDQWRQVWPRIRRFTFLVDQLVWGGMAVEADGRGLIWLACPWTSEGRRDDGTAFLRPGRMTATLERRDDRWLAVHTHHSVNPK